MKASRTSLVLLAATLLASQRGEAHKPITSPYTYNEDVFPILRDRCGSCHVTGGVAPMSLMTYNEAYPWGESIRTELIAGHMPPWSIDQGYGRFKNARTLTARELNVLLTWVTGGNPVGNPEHLLEPVALRRNWRLGPPDLVVPLPSDFTLAADTTETTAEFILPTARTGLTWIRAVDLLPGNAALVRSATVAVRSRASTEGQTGTIVPDRVLAVWVPGEDPVALEKGSAYRLPAGADLIVRVHYKKTWQYERLAMTDRSAVGLYVASPPAAEVTALTLQPPAATGNSTDAGNPLTFSQTVSEDVQAIALYPDPRLANATVRVTAFRPDGSRVDVIRFRPQPDWTRRYWFEQPLVLPHGTRIEVSATFDAPLLPPGAVPVSAKRVDKASVALTFDVVSR